MIRVTLRILFAKGVRIAPIPVTIAIFCGIGRTHTEIEYP